MSKPPIQIRDEFEIIAEIGAGGMATVYKAIQRSLRRQVAIKELKKAFQGDDQIVRRFERESQVAASLQHENIVHIYDYWKKPAYCIVMEYVDGTTLADVIAKTGPLPIDVGIMIAIQVCNALDYAHMRGLVHRDIKPGNVMIRRNGEVKLMDFGIAHTRNLESLTIPGTLIGTPSYMSPEQVLGQQLDARSDIFSFGIVLYEMFTGTKPFTDDETRSVSAKIVKDVFLSPRRVNSDIPRSLQWTIKKCLRKKPHKRYASMLEIEGKLGRRLVGRTTKAASLHRISDYLVSLDVFEPAPEQETMLITKVPRGQWLRKVLYTGMTVLLLAAGAAGALYYERTRADRTQSSPTSLFAVPQGAPATVPPVPAAVPGGASVEQKSQHPAPAKKKTTAKKKKRKKTQTYR